MTYPIDTQHQSPNHSPREGVDIDLIVLHATVGSYASALSWMINPVSRVSSHYLIRKDGHIAQLVPDALTAWHAGRALWHGVTAINECSLGIELENDNTGHDPYPPAQLAATHWLCQDKIARYNIERADVTRHLDVAMPRGRKTDPAGLPWPAFADSLYLDIPILPIGQHYRVKATVTAGATIRSAPTQSGAKLGTLPAGAAWQGVAVPGQQLYVLGFGGSNLWVRDSQGRYVWSGLLDEAT